MQVDLYNGRKMGGWFFLVGWLYEYPMLFLFFFVLFLFADYRASVAFHTFHYSLVPAVSQHKLVSD